MKNDNVVQEESYAFAVRIVKVYNYLCEEKKEYTLSKQLLRSGSPIGVAIEEAIGSQTRKYFFAKLTISYKEAKETKYWIKLLTDTDYLSKDESHTNSTLKCA